MHSKLGKRKDDALARLEVALEGEFPPDRSVREEALVYGPYNTLPATGRYTVSFSLRLGVETIVRPEVPILRVDVYSTEIMSFRVVKGDELKRDGYTEIMLEFEYTDERLSLEYRVILLPPGGVHVWCDVITVEPYSAVRDTGR
jgi:hypothetical protein